MVQNLSVLRSDGSRVVKKWKLFDPVIFILIAEVGLNFFRFLKSLGISEEQNLVVLSSRDNYSCTEHALKDVRIIINLKKLNLIKHLDLFLNSLVRILPLNTSFIGYFSEEKAVNRSGFKAVNVWHFLRRFENLSGSRRNHIMNRDEVTGLLEKNGFKTLIMKEMNGLTYFISQNVGRPS